MTAAQFQSGIDREGAKAFTARITKESDPHNWDEPNYDIILNHIATGQTAWLKIAGEIHPYATDPNFKQGLRVALAYALLENPAGVLRMRSQTEAGDRSGTDAVAPPSSIRMPHSADNPFASACTYPFPQPSAAFVRNYQRRALAALKRVQAPEMKGQTEDCRKQLLTLPSAH